jgi:hypothetical protein
MRCSGVGGLDLRGSYPKIPILVKPYPHNIARSALQIQQTAGNNSLTAQMQASKRGFCSGRLPPKPSLFTNLKNKKKGCDTAFC